MYNLIITKAINYAVLPVIAKAATALDDWWSQLSPSTRSTIYTTMLKTLYPIYAAIDGLRWAIVRGYVIHPAPVWALSRQIDALAFSAEPKVQSMPEVKPSKTRYYVLPLVLLLSPIFYLADISRSIVAGTKNRDMQPPLELMWQAMFGSGASSGAGSSKKVIK